MFRTAACLGRRTWFYLTRDEQKALFLVLALFLLGLTVRFLRRSVW